MLSLLKITNFALIDDLSVEFGQGLNLLTGETGSGKSIIVDSVAALTGGRVYSELIKEERTNAKIEGVFEVILNRALSNELEAAGIEAGSGERADLIVRREIYSSGKNRVFVNDRVVTQGFLKRIGGYLADIHGQGEQASLFSRAGHLEMLDRFAGLGAERKLIAEKYSELSLALGELDELQTDEADKLQLLDILQFQVEEISRANIKLDEEDLLEKEKKRLNNVGRLAVLSEDSYNILYEKEASIVESLAAVRGRIAELAEFDSRFSDYLESLESAQAVLEDLSFTVRDFAGTLEHSPDRLAEIEDRLAEIARLKRKYGGTTRAVISHLESARLRLESIETAEDRARELESRISSLRGEYLAIADKLHAVRKKAAARFGKQVEKNLGAVALEKAAFRVQFDPRAGTGSDRGGDGEFTPKGYDRIEFYFSANPGESPKPLAKVASGGEASRLMLILKTTSTSGDVGKSAVFDEIDAGIGGRVAEAVGLKLQELADAQQVLCVTHQPQIASLADHHFVVEKSSSAGRTRVGIRELSETEKVSEIARMLAGETVSDTAREHAAAMLKAAR